MTQLKMEIEKPNAIRQPRSVSKPSTRDQNDLLWLLITLEHKGHARVTLMQSNIACDNTFPHSLYILYVKFRNAGLVHRPEYVRREERRKYSSEIGKRSSIPGMKEGRKEGDRKGIIWCSRSRRGPRWLGRYLPELACS
jgi:hypothetical protein